MLKLESIIILDMESTNFETEVDATRQKAISLADNSNILSQPQYSQEMQHVDIDRGDESEEEPPYPIEDEDEKNSSLEFSDQYYSDEDVKENQEPDIDQDQKENINLHLKQQDYGQIYLDEEVQGEGGDKNHPKPKYQYNTISLRPFQTTLIQNSRDRNSIIYLPTGTGKTRISICSMYYYLCKYGTSKKIVFLANTIQLVKQQAEAIKQTLASIINNETFAKDIRQKLGTNYIQLNWKQQDLNNQVICIHGEKSQDQTVTKRKRIQSYMTSRKQFLQEMKKATVTVMISQMFLNCLRRGYIKLTDYSFMVFDQCHHCGGDHPFMGIMKEFYFQQKKKNTKLQIENRLEERDRLPIIMGLTASPVSQPFNDHAKLAKQLRNLCINLDSNFAQYPYGNKITNETQIQIKQIVETPQKQLLPELIDFFDRFKDHNTAYSKIKIHFPSYYKCISQVITKMTKKYACLDVEVSGQKITDLELYLFYDIKQCLLTKLRDLWLELGEFAFTLGFHEMVNQIIHLRELRNQQNRRLLNDLIDILKRYDQQFYNKYGKCQPEHMSCKLRLLIEILKPLDKEQIQKEKVSDMVLVFAFKRRTVKYLQIVLEKYRDLLSQKQKKFYSSVGITGYSSNQKTYRLKDGHSYESNPSQEENQRNISKYYNNFIESQRESQSNRIHLQSNVMNQNKNLTDQMARMYFSKMSKTLLEVQQKYSNQVKKITQFKKRQYRVLITTSVTEEGFDIPGCNLVISFDTPFSLKSYIQIKGRARKKNSKYVIFTTQKSYAKMLEYKNIYDNTINAIYEIAINQIALQKINSLDFINYSPSYQKAITKGGALLNTNYSLELVKSYFTSLKQPNRPYFHFIETSNICYKCIIKFPESSTCSRNFVVGKPFSKKEQALKSASFQALKILKKEGFIRDDLRPSRLEELQDEQELQKYDDLGVYSKDQKYKQIFDRYVLIQECSEPQSKRKLVKFYFKYLEAEKLQFPQLNKEFDVKKFESNEQYEHQFQIYHIKFGNKQNSVLLAQDEDINQIGILTCFSKEETQEIFAGFHQRFQPLTLQSFELKLLTNNLLLKKTEYQEYKRIHNFLLAGQKNNEIDYYNYLNNFPSVLNPNWTYKESKKINLKIDQNRKYFPLVMLLKKSKQKKQFEIDEVVNEKILKHIDLLKKLYMFHNKPAKYNYQRPFEEPLKEQFQVMFDCLDSIISVKKKKYLLQSISKDFCFHKGFITSPLSKYDKKMEEQDKIKKKNSIKSKYERSKKIFQHFQKDISKEDIIKLQLWKQASKEDITVILNKQTKIKKLDDDKGNIRLLKEFVLYPITYPTMLRISLAVKYVYQVFEDYSIALYFRKYYLSDIFGTLKHKVKIDQIYNYTFYKSIVLQNLAKLLQFLQQHGKSKYLRDLGKVGLMTYDQKYINMINPQLNNSQFIFDVSSIQEINMSVSLNQSNLNSNQVSHFLDNNNKSIIERVNNVENKINLDVLKQLKIQDILRSLTSKIYKHNKSQNYQEFQFIGDVVLKYLATLQIFLEKTTSQEGQMHISRANIICNSNLHRAAIQKKLFLYTFTTKKKNQPAPLIKQYKDVKKNDDPAKFQKTNINILGRNDDDFGYQYIPGKVHADLMEALIGIFYLKNKNLSDCQTLLYTFGVLNKPNLHISFNYNHFDYQIPKIFRKLQEDIGYSFKHKGLLIQALTHFSFISYIEDIIDDEQSFSRIVNQSKNNQSKNMSMLSNTFIERQNRFKKHETFYERLQFLGDSFLDLLVVEYLYDKGGDYLNDEGTLSFLKQSAVSNKTLGFIALKFNLHDLILMDLADIDDTLKEFKQLSKNLSSLPSPIEFSKLKIGSLKILGDVFQSLIGAILIDNEFNYENTKTVVMKMMSQYIKHFTSMSFIQQCPNYKFKEYLDQNNYKKLKLIKVVEEQIINGEYLYRFVDKSGNLTGKQIRACNDKDAWDKFFQAKQEGQQ